MKTFVSTLMAFFICFFSARGNNTVEASTPCLYDTTVIYRDIDSVYADQVVEKSFIAPKKAKPDLYSLPYSMTTRHENWGRLAGNTAVLFSGGMIALGVLAVLPEDATAWNKAEIQSTPLFKRWWKHVKEGPVIDGDKFIFNYVLHPYAGAAYYMSARSQGFNVLGSFLYSSFISTIFWEYGIEAFMEIPSIQDLIITPIVGSIMGEGFYLVKRWLVDNGYEVMGSRVLGYILGFLVDPVNECLGYFRGNPAHDIAQDIRNKNFTYMPWMTHSKFGMHYGISVNYKF